MDTATQTPVALKLNAQVKTANVTQSGNEELGMKEKVLYFLVIETPAGKLQINVGQKTHDEVKRLTTPREEKTVVQILKPEEITGNPMIDAVKAYKKENEDVKVVKV